MQAITRGHQQRKRHLSNLAVSAVRPPPMGAVPSLDAPQLTPAALAYDLVRAESNRAREKRAVSQRGVEPAGADGAPLSTATRQAVPPQPSSRRATPQIAPPAASASPQLPAIAEGSVRDEVERALEVGRQRAAVTIQAARRRHHVRQTLGFLHAICVLIQSYFRARRARRQYSLHPQRLAAITIQRIVRGRQQRRRWRPLGLGLGLGLGRVRVRSLGGHVVAEQA